MNSKSVVLSILFLFFNLSLLLAQRNIRAEYYNGVNFDEYIGTNYVSNIDFYWDEAGPLEGMNPHYCSVIFTGQLKTPKSGIIEFSAKIDDGIQVWIDDVLIMSNWQLNDIGFSEGKLYMEANKNYSIKIKYFNALKEAEIKLFWELPDDPNENWFTNWWYSESVIIPAEYFSSPIKQEYIDKSNYQLENTETNLTSEKIIQEKQVIKPKEDETTFNLDKYIPKNIAFEMGKSKILSVSYPALDKLAVFLRDHPNRMVKIEGHTDKVGDSKKNLILSQERAVAVARYLVNYGVSNDQILSTIGYGDTKPISENDGKRFHPENRRVEFIIE